MSIERASQNPQSAESNTQLSGVEGDSNITLINQLEERAVDENFLHQIVESSFGKRLIQYYEKTQAESERNEDSKHEWIDPEEIRDGLQKVIESPLPPSSNSVRRPSWARRIQSLVRDRENEFISLSEVAAAFPRETEHDLDRKAAANVVSWLNRQFRELEIELEFVSEDPKKYRDRETYYHFKKTGLSADKP